jgi:hypothetical protein
MLWPLVLSVGEEQGGDDELVFTLFISIEFISFKLDSIVHLIETYLKKLQYLRTHILILIYHETFYALQ